MQKRTIEVFAHPDTGELRVRVDSPGERAESAPIEDAEALIREIADKAGLNIQFNEPTE